MRGVDMNIPDIPWQLPFPRLFLRIFWKLHTVPVEQMQEPFILFFVIEKPKKLLM